MKRIFEDRELFAAAQRTAIFAVLCGILIKVSHLLDVVMGVR